MSTRRYWSYIIAATAATVALLSSWLPWYGVRLGVSMSAAANQAKAAGGFAVVADMMLRQLAGVRADAWQALDAWPAVLVVGAIGACVLASLASSGRLRDRRWDLAITGAAAVALLFVAIHIVSPPGPSTAIRALWGAYLAAAGAGVAMVAGLVAHLDRSSPAVALNVSPTVAVAEPAFAPAPPAPAFENAPPAPAFADAPPAPAFADAPPAPAFADAPPASAFEDGPAAPAFEDGPAEAPMFDEPQLPVPVVEEAPPAPAFEDPSPAPTFDEPAVPAPVVEDAPPAPTFEDAAFAAPVVEEAPPAPTFEDAAFAAPVVEEAPPAPTFEDAAFAAPVVEDAPPAPPVADEREPLEPANEPDA
jgi:hypothetical protein